MSVWIDSYPKAHPKEATLYVSVRDQPAMALDFNSHYRGDLPLLKYLDHLFPTGRLLTTAAPALLTTSSCESVPPEQPIAPMITL